MALTDNELIICNQALGYLGEYEISSAVTARKEYKLCERFYDDVVREVLCEHSWNEAKKRTILMEDATAPIFGYDYRFAMPADWVRILRLGDGENDLDHWEIEGDYILTNLAQSPLSYSIGTDYLAGQYITYTSITYLVNTAFTAANWTTDLAAYLTSQGGDYQTLKLEYIYELTDITAWSPKLRDAIIQKLAIKVSVGLVNNPKARYDLVEEYETLTLRKARSVDAQQGRVRKFFRSRWWDSRNGNYTRR